MKAAIAIAAAALVLAGCGSAKQGSAWEAAEAFLEPTRSDALLGSVATERNYAIVGWISGGRGGRILMRSKGRSWEPILCGGDGVKQAAEVQKAGAPAAVAEALVQQLTQAEAKVDTFILRRMSRFEPDTCPGLPTVG